MLSPRKVAHAIGVSEASLKRWCDKGLLPSVRTAGGHRRIPLHGVLEFLRSTGHALVRPELLSLPPGLGRTTRTLDQAVEVAIDSLVQGHELSFRQLLLEQYLAGRTAVEICDQIVTPAMHTLGARWEHHDLHVYEERRGCEMCMRVLYELRYLLPPAAESAPLAFGATVAGDIYTLPTLMVEVALSENGWRARSYGTNLPVDTLMAALRRNRPRMLWLSVSHLAEVQHFLEVQPALYEAACSQGTALVMGGRALTADIRPHLRYTAFCDNLQHLVSFIRTLGDVPASPDRAETRTTSDIVDG